MEQATHMDALNTILEGHLRHVVAQEEAGDMFKALNILLTRYWSADDYNVEYDITVTSKALQAEDVTPSVWKSTLDVLRLLDPSRYLGRQSQKTQSILEARGVLKSGRLTLILGSAGSGRSLLLRALSGRLKSSSQHAYHVDGDVIFNGEKKRFQACVNDFTWIRQNDVHEPFLTVGETSEFACMCLAGDIVGFLQREVRCIIEQGVCIEDGGPPTEVFENLEKLLLRDEYIWGHFILNVLGLGDSMDTLVGGNMMRGISGGQRRRLSVMEGLVPLRRVIMMDDVNIGLDSTTTYDVTRALKFVCKMVHTVIAVSMLQPQAEVFDLFDDVIFMESGQVLFHGPKDDVIPFFESFGFLKRPGVDPATFLSDLCNPVGQMYSATTELLKRQGISDVDAFLEESKSSCKNFLVHPSEIKEGFEEYKARKSCHIEKNEKGFHTDQHFTGFLYTIGAFNQCVALLWRQWKIELRQRASLVIRLIQIVMLGIIYGTLFSVNPSSDGGRSVISLATTSTLGLFFLSMPQISMVMHGKPLFFKQLLAGYFCPWTYCVSSFAPQICMQAIESVIFSLLVYFMAGYYVSVGYFFTYLLCIWSTLVCVSSLFRMLALLTRSMILCNGLASLMSLLGIITSGFVIPKDSIPGYIIWIYWILPVSWNVRCLSINEMTSPRWNQIVPSGQDQLGEFDMYSDRKWIWIGVGYLWGSAVIYNLMSSVLVRYRYPLAGVPIIDDDDDAKEEKMEMNEVTLLGRNQSPLSTTKCLGSQRKSFCNGKVSLFCKNISYSVPRVVRNSHGKKAEEELKLLNDISFYALPGTSTALMGGSGAGKTTLMDAVLGRKTQGVLKGERLINGKPLDESTWPSLHGYVEQYDLLDPFLTVKEAVAFSASLRLDPKSGKNVHTDIVKNSLDIVDLFEIQDRVIGDPLNGLSLEQRKRTSIALELVAQPSVIFMDEPTSGLSASGAHIVVQTIKKLSLEATVVVTIHQPSISIFESFDQLLLLHKGGFVDYFGPIGISSKHVLDYFGSFPDVRPIKDGYNPASWMLEVSGASRATVFGSSSINFAEEYKKSSLFRENCALMTQLMDSCSEISNEVANVRSSKFKTQVHTQMYHLVCKFIRVYWRNPEYNFTRLFMSMIIAAIYAITFLNLASLSDVASTNQVLSVVGFIFSVSNFTGVFISLSVQAFTKLEMDLSLKERTSNYYSVFPWIFATTGIEIPWLLSQAFVTVVITYWSVGFDSVAWKFFYFLLVIFLNLLVYCFIGQMFVYCSPNMVVSQMVTSTICQLFAIFSGFLAPYPSAPSGWRWMLRVTPTYWTVYGLSTVQYFGSELQVTSSTSNSTMTASEYLSAAYGFDTALMWWVPLILAAYCISSKVLSYVAIKFLSFSKR